MSGDACARPLKLDDACARPLKLDDACARPLKPKTAKKWVYVNKYEGFPKESDVKIVEEELRPLKDGEFLAEAVYISVDPYMRIMFAGQIPGETLVGGQIAKITQSKNKDYPVGKYLHGMYGWRTHTIVDGTDKENSKAFGLPSTYLLPDFGDLPVSLGLGVLGMPGNTSYFGFLEVCKPKAGETAVISGAAGACGAHVGQIAKLKGLRVVGITGSDEKAKWLTETQGFDAAINYKKGDLEEELKKAAPNGVDVYFDNVGGEISSVVSYQMNTFGRTAVCGAISGYHDDPKNRSKSTTLQPVILFKKLKIEGFQIGDWSDRWLEGIEANLQWIKEGKLKYEETVTEGFENTFKAFTSMLQGGNRGKAVVKV